MTAQKGLAVVAVLSVVTAFEDHLHQEEHASCASRGGAFGGGGAPASSEDKSGIKDMDAATSAPPNNAIGAEVWLRRKWGSHPSYFVPAKVEEMEVPVQYVGTYQPGAQQHVVSFEDLAGPETKTIEANQIANALFPKYAIGQKVWVLSSSGEVKAAKVTKSYTTQEKGYSRRKGKIVVQHEAGDYEVEYVGGSTKTVGRDKVIQMMRPRESDEGEPQSDEDEKAVGFLKDPKKRDQAAQDFQAKVKGVREAKVEARKQAKAGMMAKYKAGKEKVKDEARCPDEFRCCPLFDADLTLTKLAGFQAGNYCVSVEGLRKAWEAFHKDVPWELMEKQFNPCGGFNFDQKWMSREPICDSRTPGVIYDEDAEVPEGGLSFYTWTKVEG